MSPYSPGSPTSGIVFLPPASFFISIYQFFVLSSHKKLLASAYTAAFLASGIS